MLTKTQILLLVGFFYLCIFLLLSNLNPKPVKNTIDLSDIYQYEMLEYGITFYNITHTLEGNESTLVITAENGVTKELIEIGKYLPIPVSKVHVTPLQSKNSTEYLVYIEYEKRR